MAILNCLLQLLILLEQIAYFVDFLISPRGVTITTCLLSYQALLLSGCDAPLAAILASAAALTLNSGLNRPEF